MWQLLGNKESVTKTTFPEFKEKYLVESEFAYPISLNGKTKFNLALSLALTKEEVEKEVLANADMQRILNGQSPKKMIVVLGKIVNVVV